MRRNARSFAGAGPSRQRGAVLVLFVVAMVAILGIAGLALDTSHSMLNKTRLQNTLDAAALAAAKILDDTADTGLATAEALAMFAANANGDGNNELLEAYQSGELTVTVQFSNTVNPFVPGTSPAFYVRVRAENFSMPVTFSAVLGITDKRVAASAVAGPSPTIDNACNIMPMMVCGDPAAGGPYWGYEPGQPDVLKSGTTGGNWEVGPGNFQLIRLDDSAGGADVRDAMGGSYDACLSSNEVISTEPGNTVGPVAQGLNTRFGRWNGPVSPDDYPPDVVTKQPVPPLTYNSDTDTIYQGTTPVTDSDELSYNYDDYVGDVMQSNFDFQPAPADIGVFGRREAAVAIGDCSSSTNGQGEIPMLGFGCFFLLQEVSQNGNTSFIYGEFIENCRTGGMPGPAPTNVPGPYRIQLYWDPDSIDS
jgi:Flp pilus assembly protein TadG